MSIHTLERLDSVRDRASEGHARPRLQTSIDARMKTTANFRRTRVRGLAKTSLLANFVAAAYNLIRLARLAPLAA